MSYRTKCNHKGSIEALSLAKECHSMKLELLTNDTVVDDAVRFVSEHSKSKQHDKLLSKRERRRRS
jgi:hypothetical protein